MIPQREIIAWREHAPWPSDQQVEQDLLLTRAMVAIFSDSYLSAQVAMRGGTALHKVHLAPAARYSEDIDLVLVGDATEEEVKKALRRVLRPLKMREADGARARLGLLVRNALSESRILRMTYAYKPTSKDAPEAKLKIEVNCNERDPVYAVVDIKYAVEDPARDDVTTVVLRTYDINEMLGTKMRAFYQRDQGRDLFDLWWALTWVDPNGGNPLDPDRVVTAFYDYMKREGSDVDADAFEQALDTKAKSSAFVKDIHPLLKLEGDVRFDIKTAVEHVRETLVAAMRRVEAQPKL